MVSETYIGAGSRGDAGPGHPRPSSPGSAARRAAQRRRAAQARRRVMLQGWQAVPAPTAPTASGRGAGTTAISPVERERRLQAAADHLVRTMRSVAVPGVPPFSRRDRLLLGGIIAIEAVVVGLMAAAAHR